MHRLARATAAVPVLLELGACFSCFAAGTRISTPDGDVSIEDIQVGQQVYAYDESRREVVVGRVSRCFVHENISYGLLLLSDGRRLGITGNHPVYLLEEGRYVEAQTLVAAQVLLLIDEGGKTPGLRRETVAHGLHDIVGRATVYNFSVEHYENYFAGGVLVHNKSPGCPECAISTTVEISIERSGDGSGTLDVAEPNENAKFDCQASTCTTTLTFYGYEEPKHSIVLRAQPDNWSRFDGWEGLCSGLHECRLDVLEGKSTYSGRARFVRCQSGEWCPRYPTSSVQPDTFRGALVFSDAVGYVVAGLPPVSAGTAASASTLWRFNGLRLTPADPGGAPLFGISTNTSPTSSAWAVGQGGRLLNLQLGYATEIDSGTTRDLYGAWGRVGYDERTGAWFVGAAGTILRMENSVSPRPVPSNTNADLHGVWGAGGSEAWVVGKQGTILRWNGSTWSQVASGTSRNLYAIWGLGPTDVWTVGAQGTILHWDGTAWSAVPSGTTADLLYVHGNGFGELLASGRGGTLLRWNGIAWAALGSGTQSDVFSTWQSSASTIHILTGDQVRKLTP